MGTIATKIDQLRIRTNEELAEMTVPSLVEELRAATAITAQNLIYMARIWQQLEHRGVDMTPFRNGLMRFLPMIANGDVVPEAVIRFAGSMTLINQVSKLPPAKQKALADGEPIPVYDVKGGMVRERKAEDLNAKEVKQVFSETGELRTVEQQKRLATAREAVSLAGPKIAINERKGIVQVGSQQAKLSDLLLILKQHGYTIKR